MNGRGREYASALMEIALTENIKDEMYESLKTVRKVFTDSPEYVELLLSPAIPSEERVGLVKAAFEGQVHEYILSLLCVLTEKGHVRDFEEGFVAFEEMYLEMSKRTEAVVITAIELTPDQKIKMNQALNTKFGKEVDIEYRISDKIIGGVVVEVDGVRLDWSLKHRLKEIKEVMEQ